MFDRGCSFAIQWLQIEITIRVAWQCVSAFVCSQKGNDFPTWCHGRNTGVKKEKLYGLILGIWIYYVCMHACTHTHTYRREGVGGGVQPLHTVYAVSVKYYAAISAFENSHLPLQKDDFRCWRECQICRDVFFLFSLRDRAIKCLIVSRTGEKERGRGVQWKRRMTARCLSMIVWWFGVFGVLSFKTQQSIPMSLCL